MPSTKPAPRDTAGPQHPEQLKKRWRGAIAYLPPGSFGIVMATGIVSLGAHLMALPWIAHSLLLLNLILYPVLWVMNLIRLAKFPTRMVGDLTDHARGPGFFTLIAGSNIVGAQLVVLLPESGVGVVLWWIGSLCWMGLTYTIFTALTLKIQKPTLEKGISGTWLLSIVSTQSVAVLSSLLAAGTLPHWKLELNFLALAMWLVGGMLYIWMISLIFYRYTFFRLEPEDLVPSYWINMGAMAISTLAGSLLVTSAPEAPLLNALAPFIKGMTILYWVTGTWWIPILLILTLWRYGYRRYPIRYNSLYWAIVFPLGMYAVCTHMLSEALSIGFLDRISPVLFYLSLAAWVITFFGLIRHIYLQCR